MTRASGHPNILKCDEPQFYVSDHVMLVHVMLVYDPSRPGHSLNSYSKGYLDALRGLHGNHWVVEEWYSYTTPRDDDDEVLAIRSVSTRKLLPVYPCNLDLLPSAKLAAAAR